MEYKNYINGKWVKSSSGEIFESVNPATESVVGIFQKSNRHDVYSAVAAAERAFKSWSNVPAPKRAGYLFAIRDLLIKNKERLARLATQEMGKVLEEARGDVQEAIDIFEYMAGEGRRLFGITTPSELPSKFAMTVRRPIGVVGIITPWNFPFALPAWKIAPALICGNSIVFKPSSDSPMCAAELTKIIIESGISEGVFNLITGTGKEVGNSIVTSKNVKGISFTGSRAVGVELTKIAGVKRIGLELGGKNAIIVMDDANLELAVDGVLWGAFGTTGQRCTATSRVIVHHKVKKKFEGMLLRRVRSLKIGDGLNKNVKVGPLVNGAAVEKSEKYVAIGKNEGAKLLIGGKRVSKKGFFFEPTVFTDASKDMKISTDEIFGPILSIIPVGNFEEAVEVCNSIDYGLSSAIYTENIERIFKAIQKIDAGITYINSSTIGSEVHLPFGGVKETGNGTREAGVEGINEFSETKTVYIDYSGKLQRAQIDD